MSPNTQYKTEIIIGYGQLKPVIEWCERNCVADWRYSGDNMMDMIGDTAFFGYEFFFESEKDYVAFLMWKK